MYKVFIDHKPIIFIDKLDPRPKPFSIKRKELPDAQEELKNRLTDVSIDAPLYVLCKDPEKAFKTYFKSYKKITAAGGIVQRKNKFLVIKRNGLWDIPKGKVEAEESIEIGAIREIEEECGIERPTIKHFLTLTYHVFKHNGKKALKTTHWFAMDYDGPKDTLPQKKEGITKAKWMSYEDMMTIRGNTYGSINELLDVFEADYVSEST